MCTRRYFFIIILLILSACSPGAQKIVSIPTLASLPTEPPSFTPLPTNTASPTIIPPSSTPNLLATQVVQLQASNEAVQVTLTALLTRDLPSATPRYTLTPSQTITQTLTPSTIPSTTPRPVAMQPQTLYVRNTANLRTCASRECESITQLHAGETVLASGTIQGEVVSSGIDLWFRVEYGGRELYIYSQLVTLSPPTAVPVIIQPPTEIPLFIQPPANPPISVAPPIEPPAASGGCPSITASCGSLTCSEAYACLAAGHQGLDRDHDGVPCESICN